MSYCDDHDPWFLGSVICAWGDVLDAGGATVAGMADTVGATVADVAATTGDTVAQVSEDAADAAEHAADLGPWAAFAAAFGAATGAVSVPLVVAGTVGAVAVVDQVATGGRGRAALWAALLAL